MKWGSRQTWNWQLKRQNKRKENCYPQMTQINADEEQGI